MEQRSSLYALVQAGWQTMRRSCTAGIFMALCACAGSDQWMPPHFLAPVENTTQSADNVKARCLALGNDALLRIKTSQRPTVISPTGPICQTQANLTECRERSKKAQSQRNAVPDGSADEWEGKRSARQAYLSCVAQSGYVLSWPR